MVEKISVKEALLLENSIVIDTRSPKEYALDHLPKSINVPIFSNEERVIVGTIYKQISREKAVEEGIKIFSKNLPDMMQIIDQHKDKQLIIQCWRGGMRSRALAAFLDSLGYRVFQLSGGYKAFRAYVREALAEYVVDPKFVVLHGLTGSGKTELLGKFPNVIDLEGLAGHRGSVFGGIGLEQNSQKRFENLLWQELERLHGEEFVLIEGESKRIGGVVMPEFLWQAMRRGLKVSVERSLRGRAQAIVKEYFDSKEKREEVKRITLGLKRNISKKRKQEVVDLIDAGSYIEAVEILLHDYYDPLYGHTLKDVHCSYTVDNSNIEKAAEQLRKIMQ